MRGTKLYLRERRVPAALATGVPAVVVCWALAQLTDDVRLHQILAILAVTVGVSVVGPGLAGADSSLERSTAVNWTRRRTLHLVTATAALVGLLAGTAVFGTAMSPASVLVRDAAGLGGLLGIGAVLLGANLAWLFPVLSALMGTMLGPMGNGWYRELVSWTAQPEGTTSATVTAAVLAVTGVTLYAVRGSRR